MKTSKMPKALNATLVTIQQAAKLQQEGVSNIQFEGMLQGLLSNVLTMRYLGQITEAQQVQFEDELSTILRANKLRVMTRLSLKYDIVFVTKS